MKVVNKTKGTIISDNTREIKSFKEKLVGLIGKDGPEPIYFHTRWGIHTIGMSFPIDCMVVDDNMVVRKVKSNLSPGNFFLWNPKYSNVFEFPAGTIKKSNTRVLDKIEIKD